MGTSIYLDEDPNQNGGGSGVGGGDGGASTQPVRRPVLPPDRSPSTQPVGPKLSIPLIPTASDTSGGNSGGGSESPAPTNSGGGSLHGPGEVWHMGPNQGCIAGYVEHQLPDGSWTCITQSDFQKIFSGDFQPVIDTAKAFGFKAPDVGQGAGGDVAPPASGAAAPSNTQGPGSTGATAAGGGGGTGSTAIDRLIDLAASQFAGAGASGSDTATPGFVSAPIGGDTSGGSTSSSSSSSGLVILVVVAALGIGGYMYYKHHKGKAKAAA